MLATKFEFEQQLKIAFGAFGVFLRDRRGASAIEYAVIAAGISVVIVAVVVAIGSTLQDDYFQPIADTMGKG